MSVLEMTIERIDRCAPAVASWNYWDLEHGPFMHRGFKSCRVLHESGDIAVLWLEVHPPILRFLTTGSMHVLVRRSPTKFAAFSVFFGAPSRTLYTLSRTEEGHTRYRMDYRFDLAGWRALLRPFVPALVRAWNRGIWSEDVPMRARRDKFLRWGFQDFHGMPDAVAERLCDEIPDHRVPLPRASDSPANAHPLRLKD